MDLLNNLDLLSVGIATAANLTLGSAIFFSQKKSATNILFFFQTLVLSVWSIVNYLSYQIKDPFFALVLVRMVLFFAIPNSVVFLLLMHTFPSSLLKFKKRSLYLLIGVCVVAMLLTLSPILFTSITINQNGAPTPTVGPGIIVFIILAILPIPLGFYYLTRNFLKAVNSEKKQLSSLLFGAISMFLLIIFFDVGLPILKSNTSFIPLSAVFTFPFVAFTSYAITRHRLFNIKIVSSAVLVFLLATVTFGEVIFSQDLSVLIFRASVFVLVLVFGILLIKSVLREVEQREKIEKQEKELEIINAKLNETNTQLGVANERLRELDKQKSEFVSMASHQLRSPLTAIKGYASLILDGDYGVVTDDLKHAVKIIFDSAQTLATVVSDYLNVTRIELGKMKYDLTNFDLRDLVVAVTEELRPNVEKAGLKLDFTCDTSRHYNVNADKEKLKQVLMNLIDNSVKYTPKGSVHVSLEQKPGRQVGAGTALFAVKDTGIGIHKDVIPKLFGKFSRADNIHTRDIRGTGLGLYIAKQIVEAHQGKIWAESGGEEKGSQFYLELPMVG